LVITTIAPIAAIISIAYSTRFCAVNTIGNLVLMGRTL
ncbi:MAG: hypothetical protein ACI80H_001032, partial [Pseudoalteromonas distincta]